MLAECGFSKVVWFLRDKERGEREREREREKREREREGEREVGSGEEKKNWELSVTAN